LLEAPAVRTALETRPWSAVQDSLSGPRREAMELGTHEFADALRCRLIVSRFAVGRKNRGAGKAIGKWKYEMYLTDLPESRWAAADAVTLYYGRTALENRFAAEDRDFGLDRVLSYNTPGQALACAVALMIWNLRLVLGLRLVDEEIPPRPARHRPCLAMATPRSGEAELPPDETALADNPVDTVRAQDGAAERTVRDELRPQLDRDDGHPRPPHQGSTRSELEPQPDTSSLGAQPESPDPRTPADHTAVMEAWCDEHPGWSSRPDVPALLCPKGQHLRLSAIRHMGHDQVFLRFRATGQACDNCPIRSQCAPKSHARHLRREVNLSVAGPTPPGATPTSVPFLPSRVALLTTSPSPPPLVPAAPILLPAPLRRATLRLIATACVSVLVVPLDFEQRKAQHLALSEAERQQRRLTRAQRVALNDRPNAEKTRITIRGPAALAEWLGLPARPA
jgi:hypothetical protein